MSLNIVCKYTIFLLENVRIFCITFIQQKITVYLLYLDFNETVVDFQQQDPEGLFPFLSRHWQLDQYGGAELGNESVDKNTWRYTELRKIRKSRP